MIYSSVVAGSIVGCSCWQVILPTLL